MVFNWKELLALAKALQNSGIPFPPEATKRTIVSRAYYAAFCFLRNYAENHLGFRRKATGQDHRLLRDYLRAQGYPWNELADSLADLQKWRGQCDYDDTVENLDKIVTSALSTAEDIIQQCG